MKPKQILMLSILAGLLAVVLVQVQLRGERGETIVLFRATETVAAGETLGARMEAVTLPGDKLFPNLLKEAPTADMRDFVGSTPLREAVQAGQIVLYRHLESTVDPGLKANIPAGKKAISIEVDSASAVAYFVEPQDRVDVLAAVPDPNAVEFEDLDLSGLLQAGSADPRAAADLFSGAAGLGGGFLSTLMGGEGTENLRTEVLLEGVEVLAVGPRYRRTEVGEAGAAYETVTLLVSEEEATKVAHARQVFNSPMTLVLRSPEDGDEG